MTQDGIPMDGLDDMDTPEIDIADLTDREPWMCGRSDQDADDLVAVMAADNGVRRP